jgi:CRISPR-associated protein Cmr4
MTAMTRMYEAARVAYLALDPVHIGSGGYRLGRVDLTIAREPGTNLPKIPGSSLAGAARSYAAMRYGKPEAAGQHKKFSGDREACPIVFTFGTATDTGGGQAGTVSFGDAQILFFPVASMRGPVWVTTNGILGAAGFSIEGEPPPDRETICTSLPVVAGEPLNLRWLLFAHIRSGIVVSPPAQFGFFAEIANRIVLVHPDLFEQVVSSNLEVRTSVSIDPVTGAAEDGALFSYEAIPRATWLVQDVIQDNYRGGFEPVRSQFRRPRNGDPGAERLGDPLGEEWNSPLDVAFSGLRAMEYLGVGGMGTRGFGRLKLVGSWPASRETE